jgi:hypothetical protein
MTYNILVTEYLSACAQNNFVRGLIQGDVISHNRSIEQQIDHETQLITQTIIDHADDQTELGVTTYLTLRYSFLSYYRTE